MHCSSCSYTFLQRKYWNSGRKTAFPQPNKYFLSLFCVNCFVNKLLFSNWTFSLPSPEKNIKVLSSSFLGRWWWVHRRFIPHGRAHPKRSLLPPPPPTLFLLLLHPTHPPLIFQAARAQSIRCRRSSKTRRSSPCHTTEKTKKCRRQQHPLTTKTTTNHRHFIIQTNYPLKWKQLSDSS